MCKNILQIIKRFFAPTPKRRFQCKTGSRAASLGIFALPIVGNATSKNRPSSLAKCLPSRHDYILFVTRTSAASAAQIYYPGMNAMVKNALILLFCLFFFIANPAIAEEGPTATTQELSPAPVLHMTTWGEKFRQAGTTGLVQLALSVFGACFVFERLFHLRQRYIVPRGLADHARALWKAAKFEQLEKLATTQPSTLARVISFIAENRKSPLNEVSEIAGDLVSREIEIHNQRAYPLGIVATLSPLLGLLGMILGMIQTFETVALAGSLGDPTQLAAGISEALVTTGLGLAIAIPFLALYHFFKFRTAGFAVQLEAQVTSLITSWLLKADAEGVETKEKALV